jgi:hypothetical protein
MSDHIGPVIDDSNYYKFIHQGTRGYFGMFPSAEEKAECKTFEDIGIPLIPEKDWDDIIDEIEKAQARIYDMCVNFNLHCLNQGRTNYCWVNAPTHCCEIIRLLETGRIFNYSPASAGAPIKNFRNVGGWGSQALERFKTHGLNYKNDWPVNAIDNRYYTDENKEKALKHTTLEYFTLSSWEERISCILAGIPTADGYNWWRHEVCGTGILKRSHDLVIRNSWGMDWGDKGFGTLSGSKKYANDSVAITAMKPI